MLAATDRPFPSAVELVLAGYGSLIGARHASPLAL